MNLISSIWNYKCPRCRKGDLFIKPLDVTNPLNMHENCSHCGQSTSPEPGYYYGAMFISYIWTSFMFLGFAALCIWGFKLSVNTAIWLMILFGALIFLFVLRVSRSMYIHMDVRYDPETAKEKE